MSITVVASNGVNLPIYDIPQTFQYSGSNLISITVEYQGITYIQTFTYTGSDITSISNWVAQS